jgi:hypothetical protein
MRYVSAVLVVVPAAELMLLLAPLIQEVSLFLLFFSAVMLSAFVGGGRGYSQPGWPLYWAGTSCSVHSTRSHFTVQGVP